MTSTVHIPIHRLLEKRGTTALLEAFAELVPQVDVTLLGGDGNAFVGELQCPADALTQALAGQAVKTEGWQLVPLSAGGYVVGVLALHGPDLANPRVNAGRQLLEQGLAMLLTQALERREIAQETLDRYREVNLLYNIGESIGKCLDAEEIPRLVLIEANRVIRADAGIVLLAALGQLRKLDVKDSFGPPRNTQALQQAALTLCEQVYASGQSLIAADLPAEAAPLGAALCAPLKTQERVLGMVLLGRLAGRPIFTAGEEKLLAALAGQAAISVENAMLFADITRQRDAIAGLKSYMDNIFASIASGVITTDDHSTVTTLNRAAEAILAIKAEESMGRPCDRLPGFGPVISPLVSAVQLQDDQVTGYEIEPEIPRRGPVVLRVHISPLKDSQQETTGVAIVVDDLTQQRQLQQEVLQIRGTFERYVAPRVVEQLLSDPRSVQLGGVKREVTTLYADIRGFTAFGEKYDPEFQIEVLNRHLTLAAEAILEEEGTLDKFVGDAVMALFNAPLPQTDHILRAVRAALAMQRAITALHAKAQPKERLSFGIGVATGQAVIGNIGSAAIHNYTAIGDSVNIAARLQKLAGPGQVLVTASTFAKVSRYVTGREMGVFQLRGDEPTNVFEVLGLVE